MISFGISNAGEGVEVTGTVRTSGTEPKVCLSYLFESVISLMPSIDQVLPRSLWEQQSGGGGEAGESAASDWERVAEMARERSGKRLRKREIGCKWVTVSADCSIMLVLAT